MRFAGQTSYTPVIPPPAALNLATSPNIVHSAIVTEDSGTTGIIIPPGSPQAVIQLNLLIMSWTEVVNPGQMNITGENYQDVFSMNQGGSAGTFPLAFDSPFYIPIGEYGLNITNTSVGGTYTVNAYYITVRP